jgi:hypothetical protein
VKAFPDTTTGKGAEHPSRAAVLAAVLAAVGLGAVMVAVSLWPDNFAPGETLISPGARDIAVSQKDTTYPDSDALRFDERPEAVYVYVRVEDLAEGDFEARAGRTAKDSVLGRMMGDSGIRVVGRSDQPLGVSGEGVSGVLKFAVLPDPEGRLPAGNYTVEVYNGAGGAVGGALARKYFVVGD